MEREEGREREAREAREREERYQAAWVEERAVRMELEREVVVRQDREEELLIANICIAEKDQAY